MDRSNFVGGDYWKLQDVTQAFFPVELRPMQFLVDAGRPDATGRTEPKWMKIPGRKAVVDVARNTVLSCVSDDYRIFTNKEAFEMSEIALRGVFGTGLGDFECYNILMPSSRASCTIDLVEKHPNDVSPFRDDPWNMFLRIRNSYNRTSAISFQVGFCRRICKNGMIFGNRSMSFSATHTDRHWRKDFIERVARARVTLGTKESWKARLAGKLAELKGLPFSEQDVMALHCKVFEVKLTEEKLRSLPEHRLNFYRAAACHVRTKTAEYFSKLGGNAYAALNVMTDYATYPVGSTQWQSLVPGYQRKVGAWMDGFPNYCKISSMKNYFEPEERESARLMNGLA